MWKTTLNAMFDSYIFCGVAFSGVCVGGRGGQARGDGYGSGNGSTCT